MYNPSRYNLSMDDIPDWMRPQYRGVDWSLLAVVALCFVLVLPLLTRSGIPPAPEAESQIYRIIEVSESFESGTFYPRWAANFNYGYGSPIFNHVAPLPHYAGGLYVALIQDKPVVALKVLIIGAVFVLGLATFSFCRRRYGELAGVWATALLLFSPYLTLTLPYLNGDVGKLWAVAALAFSFWAADRTLILGNGRDVLVLAFGAALMLLSHTQLGLLCWWIVAGWVVVQTLTQREVHFYYSAAAMLFGGLTAAFYWVPALGEAQYFKWITFYSYPEIYPVDRLFAPLIPIDRMAFNAIPYLHFGVATWLFALVGGIWFLVRFAVEKFDADESRRIISSEFYFVFLALLSTVWLVFSSTETIQSFQTLHPTDIMLIALFAMAVLSTHLIHLLENRITTLSRRLMALGIIGSVMAFSAATSLYVPTFLHFQTPLSLSQHFNDEVRGNMLGSFRNGWFLPSTVETLPSPAGELSRNLQNFPPNTQIRQDRPTDKSYEIESSGDTSFTLLIFDYPGWEVRQNGNVIPNTTSEYSGLIDVPLNAGLNRVDVQFQNTTIRTLAWAISIISGGSVLLLVGLLERRNQTIHQYISVEAMRQKRQQQLSTVVIVLGLSVFVLVCRASPDLITRQTPENAIATDVLPMDVLISGVRQNGISLLGYQISQSTTLTDDMTYLTIHWKANSGLVDPYQLNVLVYEGDEIVANRMYGHLATWPTRRWPQNQYVIGHYQVPIPQQAGTYHIRLEIGLGTCDPSLLAPCNEIMPSEIYDLRGPTGQQIVLPQQIIVYN